MALIINFKNGIKSTNKMLEFEMKKLKHRPIELELNHAK